MCLHTNSAELCINFAYCMCNVYANLRWIIISITLMRHFDFLCSSFGLKQKTLSHTFSFKHIFFLSIDGYIYIVDLQIRPCLFKSKINRKLYDIGLQKTFFFILPSTDKKKSKCFSSCTLVSFFRLKTRSLVKKGTVKFVYSEKATKFCEISTNYLTRSTQDK